jgi:hypothetical protein
MMSCGWQLKTPFKLFSSMHLLCLHKSGGQSFELMAKVVILLLYGTWTVAITMLKVYLLLTDSTAQSHDCFKLRNQ